MSEKSTGSCTAFHGGRRVAWGAIAEVALVAKDVLDADAHASVLVFDDRNGRPVELDLRGRREDVAARYESAGTDTVDETPPKGPGRPRLGVVGKEVTLLPRHWAWLAAQRGGASVTLRRLVEQARRETAAADTIREAQDAAYRFMRSMVGDAPGFEEATRALFAGNAQRFHDESRMWPEDLRAYARRMAGPAFDTAKAGTS